jgi:poly(3-hydroxybutyrate) depolymerase
MLCRTFWMLTCAGVLAGCTVTVIPSRHDNFDGIALLADEATPAQPLRILIIHGMATNTNDAFNPFIAGGLLGSGWYKQTFRRMHPTRHREA